jgi:hypothetical protein
MDDQEQRPKELWERLENEPANAFAAFGCFDSLVARERNVLAAYRIGVRPDAKKPSDTWARWSGRASALLGGACVHGVLRPPFDPLMPYSTLRCG